MVGWHYLKDIYTDEFLRVGRFSRILALTSKNKTKLFSHRHIFKSFQSNFSNTLIQESNWNFQRNFLKPTVEKQTNHLWKHNEQVSKSPWITMDRKGANTFPFYNLPPEPRAISIRNFSVLLTFPFGENKRRWRLLLPRHFANQR